MSLSHLEPMVSINLFSTNCISSTSCFKYLTLDWNERVLHTSNPYIMHRDRGSSADLQQSIWWVRSCLNRVCSDHSSLKWTARKRWILVVTIWEFPSSTLFQFYGRIWRNTKDSMSELHEKAGSLGFRSPLQRLPGIPYFWGGTSYLLGKRPEREYTTFQVPF